MNDLVNILRSNRYSHRPCMYLSVALSLGIYLGRFAEVSWPVWSLWSGFWIILGLLKHRWSCFSLLLAITCLGAFYFQSSYLFAGHHVAFLGYQDQKRVSAIEGTIHSEVQIKPTAFASKLVFELEISAIKTKNKWEKASGRILVNCFLDSAITYGDTVRLEGGLTKAFQDPTNKFSYQRYLEEHGLFFIFNVPIGSEVSVLSTDHGHWFLKLCLRIKDKFKRVLAKYLEPSESHMIQAMVLGDRTHLTKDIYTLFSKTGTSHILAISGMNMAIISAILLFLFKVLALPRRWQFILTGVFLFSYAVLSGWSPSVVRSVIMAIVVLSSFCLEHEGNTANSIGLAAIILLLLDPMNLFDVGFQLSFICVGTIVLMSPIISSITQRYLPNKFLNYLVQALALSMMIWLSITPLIAYEFEIISLISILANIPIVPLADLIILLTLGLMGSALIWHPLALAFAGALKAIFNLTLLLIVWFAQCPGGYFYVHKVKFWHVLMYYSFLVIVYFVLSHFVKKTRPSTLGKNYDSNNIVS